MSLELNVFNQYDHAENRLTHALGITLDRAKEFRVIFLKELAGKPTINRDARVLLQMAGGTVEVDGEKCGIPDLAIIDGEDRGVVIEAKLGSALSWRQLASHEHRAERNDLQIAAALAITGRDKDRDAVKTWNNEKRFCHPWRHVSWPQIYGLACRHADLSPWVKELRDYMQIMAASLNENEMGADVKIIAFTGITDEMVENYTPAIAKRVMRSFMDELRADKAFLKDIGIPLDQPPRNRKAIKTSMRIWDFLSPLSDGDNFTKSHHFTVGINPERFEGMLTIPNAGSAKFRKFMSSASPEEFTALTTAFVKVLDKKGVLAAGGRPTVNVVQRRFKVMSQYATDGHLEFDLRTWTGMSKGKGEPPIMKQPEWLELCHRLIGNRASNIQFQLGVRFYFDTCPALQNKEALDLIKNTFRATMPIVRKTGYC